MNKNEKTSPPVTSYRSANGRGRVVGVDFSSAAGRQLTFYEFADWEGLKALQPVLTRAPLSQEIEAVTTVSGRPMLVMRGQASPSAVLEALSEQGETQEAMATPRKFDAWRVRSVLGFVGQALQMTASFLRPSRTIDTSMFGFAAANLTANTINLVYHDGEQVNDPHQLRYLKLKVNRELAPHLQTGQDVPSIDEDRAALRPHDTPRGTLDGAKNFLRRHSVVVGELGLRYFGAVALAFPARYWKAGWESGHLPQMDPSKYRVYTGLSSITGKTVALTSKVADPYNPKQKSWLDEVREKYAFLAGGLIEVTSFSALAYDSFKNGKIRIGKSIQRDWLGGIGGCMFVLGYIARSWAKFGERKVDMPELYAHTSDALACVSPEKLPQLVANSAASLAEHFEKGGGPLFAGIYSGLVDDMSRHHAAVMKAGVVAAKSPVEVLKHVPDTRVSLAGIEADGRVVGMQDLARAS